MSAQRKIYIHVGKGEDLIPMDHGKSSDPYVNIHVGDQKKKTKVKSKTLHPEWNEDFVFVVDTLPEKIEFRIWDKDRVGSDRMGMVSVEINEKIQETPFCDWITVEKVKPKDPVSGRIFVGVGIDTHPISASEEDHDSKEIASSSTLDSNEVETLRKENADLRLKNDALQKKCDELEQRCKELQKNLINARLTPRPKSDSQDKKNEPGDEDQTNSSAAEEEVPKWTPEQLELAKAAFAEYDVDGDGTIDQSELILLMEELRKSKVLNMNDRLFKRYVAMNWKAIDTDGSGTIDFDEFAKFLFKSSMLNRDLAMKVRRSSTDLIVRRRSQSGSSALGREMKDETQTPEASKKE